MSTAGELAGTTAGEGAHAWLGIPYAAPPTGPRRWRAPRAPQPWSETRAATLPAPVCPQFAGPMFDVPAGTVIGGEDCLTLDVYAPAFAPDAVPSGEERLPVMVWIHGGGNTTGGSRLYDASRLVASQSVVVVAVNYRLGPLGWFRHRALRAEAATAEEQSGNFALLDLLLALHWVRDNASAFGGDPGNVTVFGESAGARNTLSLMRMQQAKGLFHRAIVQSGGPRRTPLALAENFVDDHEAGHVNSSSEVIVGLLVAQGLAEDREAAKAHLAEMNDIEILKWMRSLTATQLLSAYPLEGRDEFGMLDLPQEFADGVVLREADAWAQFASGDYNQVPVILGSNRDEMKLWMLFDDAHVVGPRYATRARDAGRYEMIASYLSRAWKAEGVDEIARRMREIQGDSVFAYRFDWDEEPILGITNYSRLLGAAHLMDVPFVFGVWNLGSDANRMYTIKNKPGREELSAAMMSYWSEFARTGRPGRGSGGSLPEWKPWSNGAALADRLLLLDTQMGGGIRMSPETVTATSVIGDLAGDRRLPIQEEKCDLVKGMWPSRPMVATVGARRMTCDIPLPWSR